MLIIRQRLQIVLPKKQIIYTFMKLSYQCRDRSVKICFWKSSILILPTTPHRSNLAQLNNEQLPRITLQNQQSIKQQKKQYGPFLTCIINFIKVQAIQHDPKLILPSSGSNRMWPGATMTGSISSSASTSTSTTTATSSEVSDSALGSSLRFSFTSSFFGSVPFCSIKPAGKPYNIINHLSAQ